MALKDTYEESSVRKTRKKSPNPLNNHKIKGEILKITQEKEMSFEESVDFLYAVIQEQAIELERLRKKELQRDHELDKSKLMDKLFTCYQKKVDIANDRELKNHYFELREIVKELSRIEKRFEKFTMILDDLK
ncbi:hypothetical protein MTP04_08580 [Lysinibacillus sp. PLM2]|nr:hypothetical protein MTP04_08580 [Lysinibacillus sp. PLM2]